MLRRVLYLQGSRKRRNDPVNGSSDRGSLPALTSQTRGTDYEREPLMATKRNNPELPVMTVEVHSTVKKVKATGNEFRSYFATAVGGEELAAPMAVVFTKAVGKPRAAHAILTIDPLVSSTYGKDKYTGKTCIFISDPYTEKPVEPRKTSRPLSKPSEWTDGNTIPAGGKDSEGVKGQVEIEDPDALPF